MNRDAIRNALAEIGFAADFAVDNSYVLVRNAVSKRNRVRAALAPFGLRRRGAVWAITGTAPTAALTESGTWPADTVALVKARSIGRYPVLSLDLVIVPSAKGREEKIRQLKLWRSGSPVRVLDPVALRTITPDQVDWPTVTRSGIRKAPHRDSPTSALTAASRALLARLVPGRYPTQRAAIEAALTREVSR